MGCQQSRDIVSHYTKIAPQIDNNTVLSTTQTPFGSPKQALNRTLDDKEHILEQDKGHLTPSKSTLTPLNPQKQLQHAMEILPNFKAHWESLIEEINVVSKGCSRPGENFNVF